MKKLLVLTCLITFFSFSQPCDLGYELNGSNDYITIPNTTYINANNTAVSNRTIETWFKVDDATPRQVIFEEGGATNAFLIYVEGERFYCGAFRGGASGSSEFFRSASGDILDDVWYHVAFVQSTLGATTIFLWYLDGILQDSQTSFTVPKHTGNNNLGRNGSGMRYPNCGTWSTSSVTGSNSQHCTNSLSSNVSANNYFDGNLWGFRIWNSGRTSIQINDNIDAELSSGTNLVAYLDDDSVEYLNNSGVWTTALANGNGTTYNWSATAASSVWTFPGNWQGSNVPSTTKLQKVVIPTSNNYPVISSEVRIGRLDLSAATSQITIQDGGTLNVYYDAVNSGTIAVEDNGSFVLQDNESVTGSGSFTIERDSPDYPADYYSIWSTPVAEADSEFGSIFTNPVIIYEYDASQDPSTYVQIANTEDMEVGKGYFVRSDSQSGVFTRSFTGSMNNGCIDHTVYYNSSTDNFNLIGNPYSSALNWESFHADNSDVIGGTMYYWNQSEVGPNNSASDYISYNSTGSSEPGTTGNIASGLGIFVKTSQAGTVTFRNTHRVVGSNDQFFRNANNPDDGKSWFRLSGTTGYSPILIGFVPGATDGYENTHDGIFVNDGASIEFYSFIDSDRYEIQGRSELQPDQFIAIQLGFEVVNPGDYTILKVLDYIDPTFDILLEDTLLTTMTDLRTGDYTFNVPSAIEDNSRFILHYNYNSVLSSEEFSDDSNYINSFFSNNHLVTKVNTNSPPREIQVFDIAGKQILKSNFKEILNVPEISSGIYIIKYSLQDSSIISKKVIKR